MAPNAGPFRATSKPSPKNKKLKKARKKKSCVTRPRGRAEIDRDDQSNVCGLCDGHYWDDDNQDSESWIQCPLCLTWFHDTCAGVYGRAGDNFICDKCAE